MRGIKSVLAGAGLVVGAAALAVGLLGYWYESSRRPGFLSLGVEECRAAYGRARTPADSATADLVHPATGPQKDPNAPTCGTLRRSGGLR